MILWLHGIPGAGKTKLVSKVIDNLIDRPSDQGLAYFYCDKNDETRRQPKNILRSYVRQLSVQKQDDTMTIHESLVQLYKENQAHAFASGNPTFDESEQLLLQLFQAHSHTTLVLDALDECHQDLRIRLIRTFERLINVSKNLKIFISSRRDDDIKLQLEKKANVGISATNNEGDIGKFVTEAIANDRPNRRRPLDDDLQHEIMRVLLEKSGGMFQWAALQIRQVLSLQRESFIRTRLGKLPKDLKAAYDEIFETINAQDEGKPNIAIRAFKWVTCSARPLSPDELVVAVCQDPENDDPQDVDIDVDFVLSACQNLLDVKESGDVIKFAHLSVQEYFQSLWSGSQADNSVAKVCLSLLIYPGHWDKYFLKEGKPQHPQALQLLSYARRYWPTHVQRYREMTTDARVSALLQTFFGSMNVSGPAYKSWHKTLEREELYYWKNQFQPSYLSSLAICYFGFHIPLLKWWELDFTDVEQRNENGDSLLMLAILGGHMPVVELLLSKGAEVNAQGGVYSHALLAASYHCNIAVVELLLSKGAEVNAQGGVYGNALQAASSRSDMAVVELLLSKGAEVNAQGHYGNALQAASRYGDVAVVELLLNKGAKVNAQGGLYGNALQAALKYGHTAIIELLMNKGAKLKSNR